MADENSWNGVDRRNDGRSAFERHMQTILGGVATVILLWVGSTLLDLSREQVRTTEQLAQLKFVASSTQGEITRLVSERYTERSATEARLQKLELEHKSMEFKK